MARRAGLLRACVAGASLVLATATSTSTAAARPPAAHQPSAVPSLVVAPLVEPVWICRPGLAHNPCNQDRAGHPVGRGPFTARYPVSGQRVNLDTTVERADGSRTEQPFVAPSAPPVDCFYVYPTVDLLANPPLQVGRIPPRPTDTEMATALVQVGPMISGCRMFIPAYRQSPLTGLALPALLGGRAYALGTGDVIQAWDRYWAGDNVDPATGQRRGVVLMGHSQGTSVLASLIRQRVDGAAAQRQVVSALLIGGEIIVPSDRASGGGDDPRATFQRLPACERPNPRSPVPTGCVVAYNSYNLAQGTTLPTGAIFGRSDPAHRVLCTNPAALRSGTPGGVDTAADPRYPTRSLVNGAFPNRGGLVALLFARARSDLPTGFVGYPGQLTIRCSRRSDRQGTATWLEVDGPARIIGAPSTGPIGLHVQDYSLALGDLAALVELQTRAWLAAGGPTRR